MDRSRINQTFFTTLTLNMKPFIGHRDVVGPFIRVFTIIHYCSLHLPFSSLRFTTVQCCRLLHRSSLDYECVLLQLGSDRIHSVQY